MTQAVFNSENLTKQHYNLKPADTFSTDVDGVIKSFKITDQGDPLSRFLDEREVNTFNEKYEDAYCSINKQEVLQAKVVSIKKNKVIVEISLPEYDTLKELNQFYVNKLDSLGLLYVDSEFEFVITETQTGQLTEVRAFTGFEDEKEVIDFYENLKNEIGK